MSNKENNQECTLAEFFSQMLLYKWSKGEDIQEYDLELLEKYIEEGK